MYEGLISGGVARRLWFGEAEVYGKHLLRLDAESRRNRFGRAVGAEAAWSVEKPWQSRCVGTALLERRRWDQRDQRYERLMSVDNWR
jgi:hypothetical protein